MTAIPWFNGLLGVIQQDGDPVETGAGLNFEAPLTAVLNTSTGLIDVGVDLGAGAPVSLVQNEGVDMAARTKLNFRGMTITDDAGSDRTNVDLTTSAPGSTGMLAVWSQALTKWTASRTLTGSYSVIGDLTVTTFVAIGASPATAGQFRAGTAWSVVGKTAAAADQIVLSWGLSAADTIALGNFGGAVAKIEALATTQIDLYVADALQCRFTATAIDAQNNNFVTTGFAALSGAGSYIALGSGTVAAQGYVRLPVGGSVFGRNDVAGADMTLIAGYTGGIVAVGESGATGATGMYFLVRTSGTWTWREDTSVRATLSSGGLYINGAALELSAGTNANAAIHGNGESMIGLNIAAAGVRNLDLFGDGSADMNGGDGTIAIRECVTMPSGASSTGNTGQLVNDAGELKWLAPNGNITSIAGL